jgi:hypothetical protein
MKRESNRLLGLAALLILSPALVAAASAEEWSEFAADPGPDRVIANPKVRVSFASEPAWATEIPAAARRDDGQYQGTFVAAAGDTLVIDFAGTPMTVPCSQLRRIQISRGTRTHQSQGALIGMGVGIVVAVIVGSNSSGGGGDQGYMDFFPDIDPAPIGAFLGCAIAGSLIGLAIEEEVWVDASPQMKLVPTAGREGAGITVAVAF